MNSHSQNSTSRALIVLCAFGLLFGSWAPATAQGSGAETGLTNVWKEAQARGKRMCKVNRWGQVSPPGNCVGGCRLVPCGDGYQIR